MQPKQKWKNTKITVCQSKLGMPSVQCEMNGKGECVVHKRVRIRVLVDAERGI